jgi:acetyltransferase
MKNLTARQYLAPLLEPAFLIAIIGASERSGSIGSVLVQNMLASGYRGKHLAIHPYPADLVSNS